MRNRRAETGSTATILLVVLTAAVIVQAFLVVTLSRRVSELEAGKAVSADGAPAPIALGEEVQELRDQITAVAKAQAEQKKQLSEQFASLENSVITGPKTGATAGAGAMKAGALEALVAKAVDKKIEEEIPNREGGEWKPSLDQLKDTLKLNDYQTTQAEKILDDAKAEVFKLAGLKREDGTSKLDDLVAAVTDPVDAEGAMKDWFMSLFRDKIPGREETYISELLVMKTRTEKSLVEMLGEEQVKKMRRLNIDYLGVKTNYDPFAEYIQEALK